MPNSDTDENHIERFMRLDLCELTKEQAELLVRVGARMHHRMIDDVKLLIGIVKRCLSFDSAEGFACFLVDNYECSDITEELIQQSLIEYKKLRTTP